MARLLCLFSFLPLVRADDVDSAHDVDSARRTCATVPARSTGNAPGSTLLSLLKTVHLTNNMPVR